MPVSMKGADDGGGIEECVDRSDHDHCGSSNLSISETDSNRKSEFGTGGNIESTNHCCCHTDAILSHIYIALFAIPGCLIRIGLDHAVGGELANIENPGSVVFKSFFSNMLGCFVLGILQGSNLSKSNPLYVGLSTGLCGCITTYSKWNQQVTMLLVGAVNVESQSHTVAISAVIVGLLSFVCSYQVGRDSAGMLTTKKNSTTTLLQNKLESKKCCKHPFTVAVLLLAIILGILMGLAVMFWSYFPFAVAVCFSGILAPIGATLRYILSKKTPKFKLSRCKLINEWPTGTLLANFVGSAAIAITHSIGTSVRMKCSERAVLMGLESGFIASLTTVSTFVGELILLRKTNHSTTASYTYALITVVICVIIGASINLINVKVLLHKYTNDVNVTSLSFFDWKNNLQPNCGL